MDVSTRTQKIIAGVVLAVIVGILVIGAVQNSRTDAPANSEESKQQAENKDQTKESEEKQPDEQYVYTTKGGDSYTVMAREAVKRYAVDSKVALNPAQAVAAETELVTVAGSPELEIDQQVTLSSEAVKSAVEKAAKLTAEQQAAWRPYADLVAW